MFTQERIPTPLERQKGPQRHLPAGAWHQSTISHILRNFTYTGILYYGKNARIPGKTDPHKNTRHRRVPQEEWIAVKVPRIIDESTFEAAQERMATGKQWSRRNRKHEYLFVHGRLRCGQCGRAMTGQTPPGRQPRYTCGQPRYHDVTQHHTGRSVVAAEIEAVVWAAIERVLNNPALIATELERRREGTSAQQTDLDRERQHYTRQLDQCDKDLKRWEAAYLGEAIDLADFKAKKADIDARRASAEQELAQLDDQQRLIEQAELETASLMDYCARVRAQLQYFTLEEKQRALEMLNIAVTWHLAWPTPKLEGSLPPEIFAIVTNSPR
jgi:site-specific DNA recombinase